MVAAAILAGGQASRLGGRAKALLPIGGARIIDRQLAVLADVADEIVIVANDTGLYEGLGIRVVPDRIPGAGALGGLATAVGESIADRTIVLACDLPFVTTRFARFLASVARDVDVALPKTVDGYHPLCACWAREALPELERRARDGRRRILDVLPVLRVREIGPDEVARFDRPNKTLLFNVNTPHDYERALQLHESYHDRLNAS